MQLQNTVSKCYFHWQRRMNHLDSMFVPKHRSVKPIDIDCFNHFLNKYKSLLVLTGAGVSTESGIPDYRSEGVGLYARSNHKPVQYQEFMRSSYARKRYWARNFLGWSRMRALEPNKTHLTLAELEDKVRIVTQNVDGLHSKAGSKLVEELHGSAHRVICLTCSQMTPREDLQNVLLNMNPGMELTIGSVRPDGDVDMNEDQINEFNPPSCLKCGGILKPDIVFFGDNVPQARVRKIASWMEDSDALLVLGTSLTVFSSYRIVLQAQSLKKYIFIVNIGYTRGDALASMKLEVKCSELFKNISLY